MRAYLKLGWIEKVEETVELPPEPEETPKEPEDEDEAEEG